MLVNFCVRNVVNFKFFCKTFGGNEKFLYLCIRFRKRTEPHGATILWSMSLRRYKEKSSLNRFT